MKKQLLVTVLLLITISCSARRVNYREVKYDLPNRNQIDLVLFEQQEIFGGQRSLVVYGNDYSLRGRDCRDAELSRFAAELWSEIIPQNDLSEIRSGTICLLKNQGDAYPEYCRFRFSRKENGDWAETK